ncbi:MAG: zinc ribbon domain-containing protein [Olsenella sp.]|jgi:hypothetical protein|nr:zinc ribbon domain-containing protein [Olsenella sp.]MCI1289918.1 zinc ribbon domain-containing protein [Olsenella sp.]
MFCPECGAKNRDDAKFCVQCGFDFGKVADLMSADGLGEKDEDTSTAGTRPAERPVEQPTVVRPIPVTRAGAAKGNTTSWQGTSFSPEGEARADAAVAGRNAAGDRKKWPFVVVGVVAVAAIAVGVAFGTGALGARTGSSGSGTATQSATSGSSSGKSSASATDGSGSDDGSSSDDGGSSDAAADTTVAYDPSTGRLEFGDYGIGVTLPTGMSYTVDSDGNGIHMKDSSADMNIHAWTKVNSDGATLDSEQAAAAGSHNLTYKTQGNGWFVVSYWDGSTGHYLREYVDDSRIVTLDFTWPKSRQDEGSKVIDDMTKTITTE